MNRKIMRASAVSASLTPTVGAGALAGGGSVTNSRSLSVTIQNPTPEPASDSLTRLARLGEVERVAAQSHRGSRKTAVKRRLSQLARRAKLRRRVVALSKAAEGAARSAGGTTTGAGAVASREATHGLCRSRLLWPPPGESVAGHPMSGALMPKYLIQASYTLEGVKGVQSAGGTSSRRLAERSGSGACAISSGGSAYWKSDFLKMAGTARGRAL